MITANDFDLKQKSITYPDKKDYTKYYFYLHGELVGESNKDHIDKEYAVKEKVFDLAEYKKARDASSQRSAQVENEFEQWLFNELGISDNPKRHKLYSIVYDNAHYAGFEAMYNEAMDLVELIKP